MEKCIEKFLPKYNVCAFSKKLRKKKPLLKPTNKKTEKEKQSYNERRRELYKWTHRAKKAGVDLLPARRPTATERKVWENLIVKKENNGTSK